MLKVSNNQCFVFDTFSIGFFFQSVVGFLPYAIIFIAFSDFNNFSNNLFFFVSLFETYKVANVLLSILPRR